MVVEVLAGIVVLRPPVWTPVPAVRTTVAATALGRTATARAALTGTAPTQSGQCLRDGFGRILRGGILRGGVVRFGGHPPILHAT